MATHVVPDHRLALRAAKQAEPRMPRAPAHAAPRTGVRKEVVARAKRLLAQGYYDNTYVLIFAVARMLDDAKFGRAAAASSAIPGRRVRDGSDEPLARVSRRGGRD